MTSGVRGERRGVNPRTLMRAVLPAILLAAPHGCAPVPGRPAPAPPPAPPRPLSSCGAPAGGFIRNRGEFPAWAAYYVKGGEGAILFSRTAVHYPAGPGRPGGGFALRFDGADAGAGLTAGKERRAAAAPPFSATLTYRNIYPGVDCEFRAGGGGVRWTFMVAAGADPGAIRLSFDGVAGVSIAADGRLLIAAPQGVFAADPPSAWQYASGEKAAVPARFFQAGGRTVGFAVGRRDPRRLLVIDPPGAERGAR